MMDWKKSIQWAGLVAGAIAPLLVIIGGLSPQLRAQSAGEWLISLEFPPTEDVGQTSRTIGQGTRGPCVEKGLTALVPENNVGTTVSANPTMFWYVPNTTAKKAEFELKDSQGKEVYKRTFAISGKPGIVKVKLPAPAALEKGKTYSWSFQLICPSNGSDDEEDLSGNDFVEGEIKRTELSAAIQTKIAQASPIEQANLYAKAQIWNETLDIAAQLRNSNPQAWEQLLKSVKLEAIATEPFADCCQVEN